MKNPPHPGKAVRVSCLEPLGLTATQGAKVLGVSRQALSNLVNGRARIPGDMAVRLAKAIGSTTETWIRLQAAYDVAQARAREEEIEVERYEPRLVKASGAE
ncbi:MAG: HigA family addiction module antitoxin [Gemmatimonadaceae bacterium]|nr:HigA family addiction module antitoxin [Gemmatimonadaceae bacterium]